MSLVVTLCTICCTTRCHLLLLVVTCCTTRCHSMYQWFLCLKTISNKHVLTLSTIFYWWLLLIGKTFIGYLKIFKISGWVLKPDVILRKKIDKKIRFKISRYSTSSSWDIQSHLQKLQIDMIENGNINSNYFNNRRLHLNGKGILQFAKTSIEGIRKLYEKELLRQNHAIMISEYLKNIFHTIMIFFNPKYK